MKKILIIQSRATPERAMVEQEAYRRAAGGTAGLSFISTLDVEQSWDTPAAIIEGYNGVILGGSSDFFWHDDGNVESTGAREIVDRVRLLAEYLVERQVPTLGICFGHQLIADIFGGAVTHDHAQKKAGTHEVRLTETGKDDPLFGQLPSAFYAQYAHLNSVTRPPVGAAVLAEGDSCRFAALRYGDTVYTLQFHPELVAADFLSQPEALAPYMLSGTRVVDIVREAPEASRIIPLFIQKIPA